MQAGASFGSTIQLTLERLDFPTISPVNDININGNATEMPIPVSMPSTHLVANITPDLLGPATDNGYRTENSTDASVNKGLDDRNTQLAVWQASFNEAPPTVFWILIDGSLKSYRGPAETSNH